MVPGWSDGCGRRAVKREVCPDEARPPGRGRFPKARGGWRTDGWKDRGMLEVSATEHSAARVAGHIRREGRSS